MLNPTPSWKPFPRKKFRALGRPTSQDHALFVFLPKRGFWLEWERRGTDPGESLVSNAVFAKWHFEFKNVFNCTTLFMQDYVAA